MPLLDFICTANAHTFERFIPLPDWDKAQLCDKCGSLAEVFYPGGFRGMRPGGGHSAAEDRDFYFNHNITYRAGTSESEVQQAPNSHVDQCQCESCGRHRRRASVTEVADVNKEVRL